MSRRTALKGFVTTAAVGALGGTLTSRFALAQGGPSTLGFQSLEQVITENHAVAPGYSANVLIRWGDTVLPGAPDFDPMNQTADAQAKQFGYNCDYLAYFPLPRGSDSSEHGLLHVNHEYTSQELMFPGWTKLEAGEAARQAAAWAARQAALEAGKDEAAVEQAATAAAEEADAAGAIDEASLAAQTPEQTRIEMMAHNGSVIEVRKENGAWTVVPDSQYARRITLDTEMAGLRSGRRPRAAEDQRRPDRHQGLRDHQQLRRRQDALGHRADGRGEFPRLFRRRARGRLRREPEPRALRRPRRLVRLVAQPGPVRHRQGAERAEPLRLDGRVRSLRSRTRCR